MCLCVCVCVCVCLCVCVSVCVCVCMCHRVWSGATIFLYAYNESVDIVTTTNKTRNMFQTFCGLSSKNLFTDMVNIISAWYKIASLM